MIYLYKLVNTLFFFLIFSPYIAKKLSYIWVAYILTVYNMGSCMSKELTNKPDLKSAINTCDMDQSRHGSSHKSGSYTSQPQVPPIKLVVHQESVYDYNP